MVAFNVKIKVLQHDEFSTLFTLISSRAAIVLVLGEISHLDMGCAELAESCSFQANWGLLKGYRLNIKSWFINLLYDLPICKLQLFPHTWGILLGHGPLLCVLPVLPLGLVHHSLDTKQCCGHSAKSASGSSASECLSDCKDMYQHYVILLQV